MSEVFFALWFFWPAGVATGIPVLAARIPVLNNLNQSIDGGRRWRGRPLLGKNKTWRGLISGTAAGTLWCGVQIIIYTHSTFVRDFCSLDYSNIGILLVGFLLSLGAMLGDGVGSFVKRQLDIPSGNTWFPYDQLDFIVGGLLCSLIAVRLSLSEYLVITVIWIGMHLLFGIIGFGLHFKDKLI